MAVDPKQYDVLADLARLSLTDDERSRLAADLGHILAYLDTLADAHVEGVAPFQLRAPGTLRQDDPGPTLGVADVLGMAPRGRSPYVVVPKFMEE